MPTFAELFCERYGVAANDYVRTMLWRCMHRRGLPFVWLVEWFSPDYFSPDYDLIRGVGLLTSPDGLREEVRDFYSHSRNHGFCRHYLHIRVSVGRVTKLVHDIFSPSRVPVARHVHPT